MLRRALSEDRWRRDATSRAVLPVDFEVTAELVAQAPGVLSGVDSVATLIRQAGLTVVRSRPRGSRVRGGTSVITLRGSAGKVLAVERTALNLLMHLSGVATATRAVVDRARRVCPGFRVLATRKTLPGLRDLEKQAVQDGGGLPHRRDLSSGYLLKSTHLALVPLPVAVARAVRQARGKPVEVEVATLQQARGAIQAGARQLLLDNLSPSRAARLIAGLGPGRRGVFIEVSGGITRQNIQRYARTGADGASLGSLTHSAPALPFHLRLRRDRTRRGRPT